MLENVNIVAASRTPIGGLLGNFRDQSAPQLGATALAASIKQAGIEQRGTIQELLMGCVLGAGIGMAPARQVALLTGIGSDVPSVTINKVCGSGMKAVMLAADSIALGRNQTVAAGGMESMTNAPHLLPNLRKGQKLGSVELLDHMIYDGLQAPCTGDLMGVQAQKTADQAGLTREEQDQFAISSLQRAQHAIQEGLFSAEIAPFTVNDAVVDTDELPSKFKTSRISTLKPAFAPDGTITAANASSIADGAATLILMSDDALQTHGTKPLARLVGQVSYATPPSDYTLAPIGAIKKLLKQVNWSVPEIDAIEINEAFATVPLLAIRELGLDREKVNINGGACALGHPIGCSGARIIVTLINIMRAKGLKRGIAATCIGGGEATAVAIQSV